MTYSARTAMSSGLKFIEKIFLYNVNQPIAPPVQFKQKLKNASIAAVGTFKGVFWYLLLGAGIGTFIYGFFPQDLVIRLAGSGDPWSELIWQNWSMT